jgi:hypothetical protein
MSSVKALLQRLRLPVRLLQRVALKVVEAKRLP